MVSKKQAFNFTKSLAELEGINEWFQGENIDLDEGLAKFKRGLALIKACRKRLKEVENEFHEVRAQYEGTSEEEKDASDDTPSF